MIFDEIRKSRLQDKIRHLQDPEQSDSAVLIGLTDGADAKIILTRRASHMNSHAGEVAFPGGKREPDDLSLLATALRETEEEIGLPAAAVDVVCAFPRMVTRHGLSVTPFFGLVPEQPVLLANPAELDAVFCVPVAWLTDARNLKIDVFNTAQGEVHVPSFIFEEFRIWGLTAMMLFDFLNLAFAAELRLPGKG